ECVAMVQLTQDLLSFWILCGIIQGCPSSGCDFALTADPFMEHFDGEMCIFAAAERVAALKLKIRKCEIVPLSGPFSLVLQSGYADRVRQLVPAWEGIQIKPVLKGLGMWLGPE
ncbi:unnamed protein product, partial [Prorocentrum cordatum]